MVWEYVRNLIAVVDRNKVSLFWVPKSFVPPMGPEPFLSVDPHSIKEELRIEEKKIVILY